MSLAAFLRQYHATGRDKADGYAAAMFADMTEDERAQARAMLLERGLAGDTVDLDGLRFVGDAATVAALRAFEDRATPRNPRFDVQRRETLRVLTGGDEDSRRAVSRRRPRARSRRVKAPPDRRRAGDGSEAATLGGGPLRSALVALLFLVPGLAAVGYGVHALVTLWAALRDGVPVIDTNSGIFAAPVLGLFLIVVAATLLLPSVNRRRAERWETALFGGVLGLAGTGLLLAITGSFILAPIMHHHDYHRCETRIGTKVTFYVYTRADRPCPVGAAAL